LESEPGSPDDNAKNTLYANVSISFAVPTVVVYGITKKVRSLENPEFKDYTTVVPGGRYIYQLRFQSGFTGTFEDVVMYDVLETDGDWKGTVESIDVSYA
jgi:hypothetical protein